jgi:hypothetical protein
MTATATHRTHAVPRERRGMILLIAVSALSALLVAGGVLYATGTSQRMQASLLAAGCEPGLSSDAHACTTQPMLASQYQRIVGPAAAQLNVDAAAYTASEGHDLAAAETALTAEVTTTGTLDTSLAAMQFPPAITPLAQALVAANKSHANLLTQQARSSSLPQLISFDQRVRVSSAAVQKEMSLLRKAVDSPVRAS